MKNLMRQSERGQTLVIFVFGLVGLLAIAGLALDGGNTLLHRRRMQNAADAAAMAGARQVYRWQKEGVGDENDVLREIHRMAERNDVSDTDGTPGNEVNGNLQAYYVDINGDRLSDTPVGEGSAATCSSNECSGNGEGKCCGVETNVHTEIETSFIQLAGPSTVPVEARAAAVYIWTKGGGGYAIFANDRYSCTSSIKRTGSGSVITGNIHSNHTLKIQGSSHEINGEVEYVDSANCASGVNCVQSQVEDMPYTFDIADYRPGGSMAQKAAAAGQYYEHNVGTWNASGSLPSGLHYATGDVHVNGADVGGHVTIVAEGTIHANGSSGNWTPYVFPDGTNAGLLFFANAGGCCDWAFKWSGSNVDWKGIIYAPNGQIKMSAAANNTLYGAAMACSVDIAGSSASLTYKNTYFPADLQLISLVK